MRAMEHNLVAATRGLGRAVRLGVAAITTVVIAPIALAAPCAGFTDVDSTSAFCPNVEWLKNRAVTLGCTSATLYCPNDVVSRLAMAAFMNRLGTALTPVQLRVSTAPGAVDLDIGRVVCQTSDFTVADFPRRVYVDATLNATAPADVDISGELVQSTNAGASWNKVNTTNNYGVVLTNRWGGLSDIGYVDLNVGQTMRWGVRVGRASGTVDLADSRCNLRALIYSRDGTTSPY